MGTSQFVAVARGVVVRDYGCYKRGGKKAADLVLKLVLKESRALYFGFRTPIEEVAMSGESKQLKVGDRVVVNEHGVATLALNK